MNRWLTATATATLLLCVLMAGCRRGGAGAPPQPTAQAQPATQAQLPQIPPALKLPTYAMPDPNGYVVLQELAEEYEFDSGDPAYDILSELRESGREPTDDEAAMLQQTVTKYADALARLDEALDMEWLYPDHATPATLHPELHAARFLGRLLLMQAAVARHRGNAGEALGAATDALRLAVKLPRGGESYARLTAVAIESMAFGAIGPVIADGLLTDEQLNGLRAQLDSLDGQGVPLRETIAIDYEVQGPRSLELSAAKLWELVGGPSRALLPRLPGANRAVDEFVLPRLPDLMQYDAAIAELSERPFYEVRAQVPTLPTSLAASAMVLGPISDRVLVGAAAQEARWRGMRVMISLQLHVNKAGRYPDGLAELGLSDDVLTDPFTGDPLLYRRDGDSYILYSAGEDGQDSGGVPGSKPGTDLMLWNGGNDRAGA